MRVRIFNTLRYDLCTPLYTILKNISCRYNIHRNLKLVRVFMPLPFHFSLSPYFFLRWLFLGRFLSGGFFPSCFLSVASAVAPALGWLGLGCLGLGWLGLASLRRRLQWCRRQCCLSERSGRVWCLAWLGLRLGEPWAGSGWRGFGRSCRRKAWLSFPFLTAVPTLGEKHCKERVKF